MVVDGPVELAQLGQAVGKGFRLLGAEGRFAEVDSALDG